MGSLWVVSFVTLCSILRQNYLQSTVNHSRLWHVFITATSSAKLFFIHLRSAGPACDGGRSSHSFLFYCLFLKLFHSFALSLFHSWVFLFHFFTGFIFSVFHPLLYIFCLLVHSFTFSLFHLFILSLFHIFILSHFHSFILLYLFISCWFNLFSISPFLFISLFTDSLFYLFILSLFTLFHSFTFSLVYIPVSLFYWFNLFSISLFQFYFVHWFILSLFQTLDSSACRKVGWGNLLHRTYIMEFPLFFLFFLSVKDLLEWVLDAEAHGASRTLPAHSLAFRAEERLFVSNQHS